MSDDKTAERQAKVDQIINNLAGSSTGRDLLRNSLAKSGLGMMQVVTVDAFPEVDDPVRLSMAKRGILLDTETTGVDTSNDEIIELAMVEFFYDADGIIKIGEVYDEFNEPKKKRIDDEVAALTGITNEMVAGHRIDPADVRRFTDGASIVIAHHAGFDRKIVEANLPGCGFDTMAWHCSVNEVEWIKRGKNGRSLEVLALSEGLVYGSHRADADCIATAFVMNSPDANGRTAFAELLETGGQDTIFLIAEGSPFSSKDALKERGYRWSSDGSEAYGYKAWYTEVPATEEALEAEADFLRSEVFRKDVSLPSYRVDATCRYTDRKPGKKEFFRTAEVKDLVSAADQRDVENQPGFSF